MSDDTFRKVLETEIGFMRAQAGWLAAFSLGLADHAECASNGIWRQARVWSDEAEAAERRMQKILKQREMD